MNKQIKVSVIAPCYNGEKYLEKFFLMINKQNFKNYELIIIDDSSNDKSLELIEKYKNKKTKIIKHKINQGAGKSRNDGIKKACGKYIVFIDIDDEFDSNYLSELYSNINDADMLLCKIKSDYYNVDYEDGKIDKKTVFENPFSAAAWGKIIKKEIMENNLFAEGIINEDIPSIIGAIIDSNKIIYTNKTNYEYKKNQNSVQTSKMSEKKFDLFKAYKILKENKRIDEYEDLLEYNQIITFFLYMILEEKNKEKRLEYIKEFYKKYNKKINKNKYTRENLKKHSFIMNLYYSLIIFLCDNKKYKLANNIISIKI